MKITAATWQQNTNHSIYKTDRLPEKTPDPGRTDPAAENPADSAENTLFQSNSEKDQTEKLFQPTSTPNHNGSSKIKASVPDDNVGQLAAELANGQTKFDVLQVSSKAMRAMANLRMAGAVSEGRDKEKINQMIRRMNKLLKRIRIKMRNLEKEEQLEKRQEKAEKRKEEQKARALRSELQHKRNKRRREEQDYARKELTNSGSLEDSLPAALTSGTGAASPAAEAGMPDLSGTAVSSSVPVSADTALVPESISVDLTV